jgi:hypothetical protein
VDTGKAGGGREGRKEGRKEGRFGRVSGKKERNRWELDWLFFFVQRGFLYWYAWGW